MNRVCTVLFVLTLASLFVHLTSFYGLILAIRNKNGYWPEYDDADSFISGQAAIRPIIEWSGLLFIAFAFFCSIMAIMHKKYRIAFWVISLAVLFFYLQLHLNPFLEWYFD